MGSGPDNPNESYPKGSRWYDKDPALSRALEHLRKASDRYQAQVALNIIKIVIEHHIENNSPLNIEDITHDSTRTPPQVSFVGAHPETTQERRRWYDVNETLRSAMQLLRDTPDDLQRQIIPSIAQMIEQTLQEPFVS